MILKKFAVGALLLACPVGIVAAQTEGDEFDVGLPTSEAPANTVSCFDYYEFGSVQANLTAPISSTISGSKIIFSGTIVNNNPYPIVDGTLYVKIFRSRGASNDGNGPEVVDQFFALGDIVIPAKNSVPASFTWNVPSNAISGEYQLATFFTTSRKFNLLGLSFTDDVVGNTVPFRVVSEQKGTVAFDKAAVEVDGEAYRFAAFPPRTSETDAVDVTAVVKNSTNKAEKATISWTVYQWDAQLRSNAVQEKTETVTVAAQGSAPVSITVSDARHPVYLVVGTLTWRDTKSIIGVRFVRSGIDRLRINFPGVTDFPIIRGQENTVFSCLHNAGENAVVPNGRLELALLDGDENIIHEYVYEGDVTGAMMGVAEKFVPQKNYDRFALEARLYEGEEIIENVRLEYDCNTINPATCAAVSATEAFDFASLLGGDFGPIAVVIVIAALLVVAIVVRMWFRVPTPPPAM